MYFSGGWPAKTVEADAYDHNSCPNGGFRYYYDEVDKATSDLGDVMFIKADGSWVDEEKGPGDISTSIPLAQDNFQKKAAGNNYTNTGYQATGSDKWNQYART